MNAKAIYFQSYYLAHRHQIIARSRQRRLGIQYTDAHRAAWRTRNARYRKTERGREAHRAFMNKQTHSLSDSYIRRLLVRDGFQNPPPDIIEIRRLQVICRRAITKYE